MISRRGILTSLLATPAIIRTPGLLMPVKAVAGHAVFGYETVLMRFGKESSFYQTYYLGPYGRQLVGGISISTKDDGKIPLWFRHASRHQDVI